MASNYLGYRVKINNVIIDNTMISRGSYSCKKARRVVNSWEDALKITHEKYAPSSKATIRFNLRERNLAEQASLASAFSTLVNVPVVYWDDLAAEYASGTFKITEPDFSNSFASSSDIEYGETTIELTEY